MSRRAVARPHASWTLARRIAAAWGLLLALAACDARRAAVADPIEACSTGYAEQVGACFGPSAAARALRSFANPPRDEGARAALAGRCAAQTARLKKACR